MVADRPKIFIATDSRDRETARVISRALRDAGADVFFDEDSIPPGADCVQKIEQALDDADSYVVLVTNSSQTSQNWAAEVGFAIGRGAPIIPVVVGDVDFDKLPARLHRIQHVRWREESKDEGIAQILRAALSTAA